MLRISCSVKYFACVLYLFSKNDWFGFRFIAVAKSLWYFSDSLTIYNFLKWLYSVISIFCIGSFKYNKSFNIPSDAFIFFFPKLSVKSNILLSKLFIASFSTSCLVIVPFSPHIFDKFSNFIYKLLHTCPRCLD